SNRTDDIVLTVSPFTPCTLTGPTNTCPGATSTFTGPAAMNIYSWKIIGTNGAISGSSHLQNVSVLAATNCGQSFNINLSVTPPTVTCPANLVLSTDPGQCSRSNVNYSVSVSDSCSATTTNQTTGLSSSSTFPKGITTNTFVVTDACGNSNTCSFTVTILDTE